MSHFVYKHVAGNGSENVEFIQALRAEMQPTKSHPLLNGFPCLIAVNVIRCPVCRQECMEVDVMQNVFVKDAADAPSSTVERTVQVSHLLIVFRSGL